MTLSTYPPWGKRFGAPSPQINPPSESYRPPVATDPVAIGQDGPGLGLTELPGARGFGPPMIIEDTNEPTYSNEEHRLQDGRPRGEWEPPDAGILPRAASAVAAASSTQAVYEVQTNHATAGQYNCRLQTWASAAWADANTNNVVVKDYLDSANDFAALDLFVAVGVADDDGVVPVIPYAYAHIYDDT